MERDVIQSSILLQLKSGMLYGALGGFLWGIPAEKYYYLIKQGEYNLLSLWLNDPFSWPVCVLTGIVIGTIAACLFRTSIVITKQEIQVRQFMRNQSYPLNGTTFKYETKKKEHLIEIIKLVFIKKYLSIYLSDGKEKTVRLYFFSESKMAALETKLNAETTDSVAIEERIELKEQLLNEGVGRSIQIPREEFLRSDKRRISKTFMLFMGLLIILLLMIAFGQSEGGIQGLKVLICLCVLIITILMIPMEILRFIRYRNRMPVRITYMENHLLIDSDYYAFSETVNISLTDSLTQSSSVFPIQRYMIITTLSGQAKYWLGNDNGINPGVYKGICKLLEEAFIYTPGKIRFSSKRSMMTK